MKVNSWVLSITIGEKAKQIVEYYDAYSFVNKDVPDNSVACGVPIKIIRKKKK